MTNLLYYLIVFVISFIILLINHFIKVKKGTIKKSKEIELLIYWFEVDSKKIDYESLSLIFTLINSFIISLSVLVSSMLNLGYLWEIAVAFVFMYAFMYLLYGIISFILERRGKKNGKYNSN